MEVIRNQILQGTLKYPGAKAFEKFPEKEKEIHAFWSALWGNWLRRSETNSLYWYEQLGCSCFNYVVRAADVAGWVTSNSLPARRWASITLREEKVLEYVSPDELQLLRADRKVQKYVLGFEESKAVELVRQNGETRRTGLVRVGFMMAGNTQFGYDMEALRPYEDAVKANLVKSMDKIRKQYPEMLTEADSYDNVAVSIFDWHNANESELLTTGNSISDSRGRAISDCLGKVFNPIGNKDARAALVITY